MNEEQTEAVHDLCAFLFWAEEDKALYGARTAEQATEALKTLLGYDQETFDKLRKIFVS